MIPPADPPASPAASQAVERLKACPFCGGESRLIPIDQGDCQGGRVIECVSCQVSTRVWFPVKDDVDRILIEAWNQRAYESAQLDTLRAELGTVREVLGADLRTAADRVLTLELENQTLRASLAVALALLDDIRMDAAMGAWMPDGTRGGGLSASGCESIVNSIDNVTSPHPSEGQANHE